MPQAPSPEGLILGMNRSLCVERRLEMEKAGQMKAKRNEKTLEIVLESK
jgi:hypothetical protein